MSRHLRILLKAGIVVDERPADDARTRVFWLRPDSITPLRGWLDELQAAGASPGSSSTSATPRS